MSAATPPSEPWLTAREAADLLGIRLETLYAYVSRGMVRSEKTGEQDRARRYLRQDVEKLRRQKDERKTPTKILENALDWGGPLLESSITLIQGGRFYYRGQEAVELARHAAVEEVAALIWGLENAEGLDLFREHAVPLPTPLAELRQQLASQGLPPLVVAQALLPLLSHHDPAAYDVRPARALRTGVRTLCWLVQIAANGGGWQGDILQTLAHAWGVEGEARRRLLAAALILCVDHELNVSAFTTRCIASAQSTLYDALLGGISALLGARHGGHTRRVEALLDEIGQPSRTRQVLEARLRRGETLPGFGQRLYPAGDPRAAFLLEEARRHWPRSRHLALIDTLCQAAQDLIGEKPTVDCGLVLTARLLDLPPDSALTLFALGRAIGWIGHALEQYQLPGLIRPRARYTGILPV